MRRTKLMTAAIMLTVPMLPLSEASASTSRIESHIPAEDLDKALQTFASARGIQLQYTSDQVQGLKSAGANGALTAEEELGRLLAGTGLSFKLTGANTVQSGCSRGPAGSPPGKCMRW